MKKKFSLLLIAACLLVWACSDSAEEPQPSPPSPKVDVSALSASGVQPGQLIVKLKEEPASLDAFFQSSDISISRIERVFPHAGKFEERSRSTGLHLWYVVEYDESIVATRAASSLSLMDNVSVIEPVVSVRKSGTGTFRKLSDNDMAMFENTSSPALFSDPYLNEQWNFNNTGTINNSIAGADIRLFDAWELATGHPDVVVAVVDGGIDYLHEDLSGNMWINELELNGINNEDDDHNGYKDDIYGYNFVTGKAIEPTFHGSHVAGIIGAVNNNDMGVAGIAGGDGTPNSGVRLMSCQIFLDNEGGESAATNYHTAAAIKYGADNGAVISQNSWGFDLGTVSSTPQIIQEAIDYFISNAGVDEYGNQVGPMKGGLVVFAAGNDDVMTPTFPASDGNVVSVAAMRADYKRAVYSNYGSTIDIMAPGGELPFDLSYGYTGILSTVGGWNGSAVVTNAYYYMDGTSMACPHVSGVAALLISKYGLEQPGFTPDKLKDMLYASVYDVSVFNPGYDGKLGVGALDATKAFMPGVVFPTPPLLLRALPNLAFTRIGASHTLDLSDYFATAVGAEELTYRATTAATEIVSLELTGSRLDISTTGYGRAYITVEAIGADGLKTEATFLVSCYSKELDPDRERPGFWTSVSDIAD